MEPWWKTWLEVKKLATDKDIYLYGRSEDWLPKTIGNLPRAPTAIIDRNPGYVGTEYDGIPVLQPTVLNELDRDSVYFVVTSGVYEGIVKVLIDKGFEPGQHFACCPEFRDFYILEEIRNYTQTVTIACSDYSDPSKTRYSRAGGGIYRYHIGPNEIEKLHTGFFRQMVKTPSVIYAVDFVERFLYTFDHDFKVLDKRPLDHPNYCGVAYCPDRKIIALINAGDDTISIHDEASFRCEERIEFSDKHFDKQTSNHHLNDCCIVGNRIYVSYFSLTGTWKLGNYDGGVSELHLDKLIEGSQQVASDLWMPHSPKFLDGKLCYLDSMRGRLHLSNQTIAGEFSGFVRGLAHDGIYYYIGQSEDMYISRLFGTKPSVMLNAGFYLYDTETKASRFYPMLDNMNVHDLMIC
jgi:hypothetical protein